MDCDAPALAGLIGPASEMARRYASLVGIGVEGAEFIRRLDEWNARDAAQAVPAAESKATEANPDPTVQAPREPEPVRAAPPRHRSRLVAWLAALWR